VKENILTETQGFPVSWPYGFRLRPQLPADNLTYFHFEYQQCTRTLRQADKAIAALTCRAISRGIAGPENTCSVTGISSNASNTVFICPTTTQAQNDLYAMQGTSKLDSWTFVRFRLRQCYNATNVTCATNTQINDYVSGVTIFHNIAQHSDTNELV